jgi:lipopolysaccharide transport system permease protein
MTGSSGAELRDPSSRERPVPDRATDELESSDDAIFEGVSLALWQPTIRHRIAEAWAARHLYWPLALSLVPTYQGRILGRAWIVLRPLMGIVGFGFIFGGVFNASAPNGIPYIIFMILGVQAFRLFDYAVMYETVSMRAVKRLTASLRIPLLLVPPAVILRILITLSIYWAIGIIALAYYLISDGHFYFNLAPSALAGVAGLVLCLLFGMALGLWTMALYPRVRDMRYFVRYALQFWMFFTPVFYAVKSVPDSLKFLVQINPLTSLLELVQYGFLKTPGPSVGGLIWSLTCIALVGAGGLWFFNRIATRFVGLAGVSSSEDDEDDEFL